MTTPQINLQKLRRIIKDEIKKSSVTEAVDHKGISSIVGVASKLMAAVETFKEKAPPAAINALTPHLGELEKMLEHMVSNPGSFVPTPKKVPQKVTLKATKSEGRSRLVKEEGNFDVQIDQQQLAALRKVLSVFGIQEPIDDQEIYNSLQFEEVDGVTYVGDIYGNQIWMAWDPHTMKWIKA
jgi:hypothetical protein